MFKLFDVREIKTMIHWTLVTWCGSSITSKLDLALFWLNFIAFYSFIIVGLVLIGMCQLKLGTLSIITGMVLTKIAYRIHGHDVFNRLLTLELDSRSKLTGDPVAVVLDLNKVENEMMGS